MPPCNQPEARERLRGLKKPRDLAVRKARSSTASGFTLIELMIVLFIMGLMALIVIPHMSGVRRARLKSEARRLAGRATYLYERASADKVVFNLTFDLDGDNYSVFRLDPYGAEPVFMPDRMKGLLFRGRRRGCRGRRIRWPK